MRHAVGLLLLLSLLAMLTMPSVPVSGENARAVPAFTVTEHQWINQSVILSEDMIIEGTGHLTINSATYTIGQTAAGERSIDVAGTLELFNSTLTSDYDYSITLHDGGRLILRNSEMMKVSTLTASDGTAVLELRNSYLFTKNPVDLTASQLVFSTSVADFADGISVNSITIAGLDAFSFDITSCDDLTVTDSGLETLTVSLSYSEVTITDTDINELRLSSSKNVEIISCNIGEMDLGIARSLNVIDSWVGGGLSLDSVSNFAARESRFDMDLSFQRPVTLENVEARNLTVGGGGTFKNVTCSGFICDSQGPVTVRIYGWRYATEVSTIDVDVPGIEVRGEASVEVYRWLEINVTDGKGEPLADATVRVEDEFTDAVLGEKTTDATGRVTFAILTSTLDASPHNTYSGYVQVAVDYKTHGSGDQPVDLISDTHLAIQMENVNVSTGGGSGTPIPTWLIIALITAMALGLVGAGAYIYWRNYY